MRALINATFKTRIPSSTINLFNYLEIKFKNNNIGVKIAEIAINL